MIISVGTDVVSIPRFEGVLQRTEKFKDRVFTAQELLLSSGNPRSTTSLAGIFAAKEAIAKSLGAPPGLNWHHCEISHAASGKPEVNIKDSILEVANSLGISKWHLSISHDAELAIAFVVAEGNQ